MHPQTQDPVTIQAAPAAPLLDASLDVVHPSWRPHLADVKADIERCLQHAAADARAGNPVLPHPHVVLRAFSQPFDDVKVVILGQDPYPTPGHPIGLAFAVERTVRPLPKSLVNVYRELADDIGCSTPEHGDLSAWSAQGVMLLNRVLTVRAHASGSHAGIGWEQVTDAAMLALAKRNAPLVAILWGRPAQRCGAVLGDVARIESPHPSPLSAHRGFFGSRPFSRANELLAAQGSSPITWEIP